MEDDPSIGLLASAAAGWLSLPGRLSLSCRRVDVPVFIPSRTAPHHPAPFLSVPRSTKRRAPSASPRGSAARSPSSRPDWRRERRERREGGGTTRHRQRESEMDKQLLIAVHDGGFLVRWVWLPCGQAGAARRRRRVVH